MLLESTFKLGVVDDEGVITPAEEVIEALQRDTVAFSGSVGRSGGGSFSPGSFGANAVFFSVKAEATALSTAIEWLHKLLYRTVLDPAVLKVRIYARYISRSVAATLQISIRSFTTDLVQVQASKLLAEIPSMKRNGGVMAGALMTEETFGADVSTNHAA